MKKLRKYLQELLEKFNLKDNESTDDVEDDSKKAPTPENVRQLEYDAYVLIYEDMGNICTSFNCKRSDEESVEKFVEMLNYLNGSALCDWIMTEISNRNPELLDKIIHRFEYRMSDYLREQSGMPKREEGQTSLDRNPVVKPRQVFSG